MTNIPTELLRTLVAVVDLRSFTKAAQSLGVTQPAVSAQVKRLQGLLGADLLDKSAPGVSLTSAGELVVNYARRLLSINDQILDIAGPRLAAKTIRIGTTGDVTAAGAALGLKCARANRPDLHFQLYSAKIDNLLRDLREGETDLAIWASTTGPTQDTRHCWTEPLVWVRAPSTRGRSRRLRCRWCPMARIACSAAPHERAEQGRTRLREGVRRLESHRSGRGGCRGPRRDGAAAQPRRPAGYRGLGECAAAEAAGHLSAASMCAAAPKWKSASNWPTRSRRRSARKPRPAASLSGQQHSAA